MKMFQKLAVALIGMFGMAGGAMAANAGLANAGSLYTGLVTNVLNGEIGTVTAIGLVAFGVFMLFRSAAMAVLSLAAAVIFWNAEAILGVVLGMTI